MRAEPKPTLYKTYYFNPKKPDDIYLVYIGRTKNDLTTDREMEKRLLTWIYRRKRRIQQRVQIASSKYQQPIR